MNLQKIEVVREGKDAEADFSIWKIVLLASLGTLSSFGFVYFLNLFLNFLELRFFVTFLIFAALFAIFLYLQSILVKKKILLWGLIFVESILPLTLFYSLLREEFSYFLFLGFVLFTAFASTGAVGVSRYLENSVDVNFFKAVSNATPKAVTGIFILFAALAYFNYVEQDNFGENLERKTILGMAGFTEPIVRIWFPRVNLNITVKEFFEGMVYTQLVKDSPAEFRDLPEEIKAQIVSAAAAEIKSEFEGKIGPLPDNIEVREAIWELAKERIDALPATTRTAIVYSIFVSLMIAFRAVSFIFYKPVELLAFLAFKFLLVSGFIRITVETRQRKFVIMP